MLGVVCLDEIELLRTADASVLHSVELVYKEIFGLTVAGFIRLLDFFLLSQGSLSFFLGLGGARLV